MACATSVPRLVWWSQTAGNKSQGMYTLKVAAIKTILTPTASPERRAGLFSHFGSCTANRH